MKTRLVPRDGPRTAGRKARTSRNTWTHSLHKTPEGGSQLRTVLIADDEPNLRLLVNATISSDQCQVIKAADGDEAWSLLQEHHPDVAILDVQMPGKTGLELTRRIKSDPSLKEIMVILLTSKAQEADIQAGLSAGADHYLTKPFSPLELLTAVERALRA